MRKYLGKMHIVRYPCGHVRAACWVTGNEEDAKSFKARFERKGVKVDTIERHDDDEMPEWCYSGCTGESQ